MSENGTTWTTLANALDKGDVAAMRAAVRVLDEQGSGLLAQRIGGEAVAQLRRSARRSRETARRSFGGRVVVIHGIMGARLDVVEPDGDSDRVWLNVWRLFDGRLADLELDEEGQPRARDRQVRVAGLFPEYLPLILELDRRWKVRPFAFDWRLDIDDSAARLAREISLWAHGEPCHIVAHSMGGLVARQMIARFPDVWASMRDPDDRGRGGRLVQLGTPNRGSFAIPMVLTGREPVVRKLALLDRKHKLEHILPILASFPGSYQMLPAPGSGPDDRDRLYRVGTWGAGSAWESLLELGRRFHEGLARVIDPERTLYVAGYDRDTPYRVRVKAPGRFEYQLTRNGDGRVPHDLGLLEGVRTLWVDEVHGDLPRNAGVLAGIHDLLVSGNTVELEQSMPVSRSRAPAGWIEALPEDPSEDRLNSAVEAMGPKRSRSARTAAEGEAQRIEALALRGWVGGALDEPKSGAGPGAARRDGERPVTVARIAVEVVCGDVTRVQGDVYAVGHYVGVLPQNAEAALDRVVSPDGAPREERVLHSLTRQGVLRGELGDIALFPWASDSTRQVAVAGMGHPGSFGRSELRRLAQNLTLSVAALPAVRTVCSVLIGSGAGNLHTSDAVEALLLGAADALRRERLGSEIDTLRLVELDWAKAREIHETLKHLAADESLGQVLRIALKPRVTMHASGRMHRGASLSMALAGLAAATGRTRGGRGKNPADVIIDQLPGSKGAREKTRQHLADLAGGVSSARSVEALASRIEISVRKPDEPTDPRLSWVAGGRQPTRFSCVRDGEQLLVAALADTAVVPQRSLRFDLSLFDELATKATDPEADRADDLGALIGRLLVPHEFAAYLRRGAALVAELDRYTARLPWELISLGERHDGAPDPISIRIPFARQLRTAYSPAPSAPALEGRALRALVIGDPGDPRIGDDLPGARREAIDVVAFLRVNGVEVDARIGAPSARRTGPLREHQPAGRLEVLELLLSGRYDLVHYCGHGAFEQDDPDQSGWVFEGGLLTAREIERMVRAPRLIVANACLSGRASEQLAHGEPAWRADDAGLLPSLADEFFKRGVRDYIGTAWEVSDEGAITFSRSLYSVLLGGSGKATIGDALVAARRQLYEQRDEYDALWAAYQHYGDSQQELRPAGRQQGR